MVTRPWGVLARESAPQLDKGREYTAVFVHESFKLTGALADLLEAGLRVGVYGRWPRRKRTDSTSCSDKHRC